jgi:hypothetical protein
MTAAHALDQSIQIEQIAPGHFTGPPPKQYWNLVGPYGGISAAIAVNAAMQMKEAIGEPLAITINFTSPLLDAPYDLIMQNVRTGRTTQHWSFHMDQQKEDGSTVRVLQGMVTMGVRRDVWAKQTLEAPVPERSPEQSHKRSERHGIEWFNRYELRFTNNPMKSANPSEPTMTWVRDYPERTLDYPALAAICDSFFPAIFAERQSTMPIATVTMNTYFHTSAEEMTSIGSQYLLASSRSHVYHDGFFDAEGKMWAGDRLIATSQQVMWYRE